jgi:hypothetical protein
MLTALTPKHQRLPSVISTLWKEVLTLTATGALRAHKPSAVLDNKPSAVLDHKPSAVLVNLAGHGGCAAWGRGSQATAQQACLTE